MEKKLTLQLSDIQTGSKGLGKPKFVLNTVKHDKPIIRKLVKDVDGKWRYKSSVLEVN